MSRTSTERRILHELMWARIKETGCTKEKALEGIGLLHVRNYPVNECFACEEAGIRVDGEVLDYCVNCPIVWYEDQCGIDEEGIVPCEQGNTPFFDYDCAETKKAIKEAAARMLKLPYQCGWNEDLPSKNKKQCKLVLDNVEWGGDDEGVFPIADIDSAKQIGCDIRGWDDFIGKPNMKMTLEWEE